MALMSAGMVSGVDAGRGSVLDTLAAYGLTILSVDVIATSAGPLFGADHTVPTPEERSA